MDIEHSESRLTKRKFLYIIDYLYAAHRYYVHKAYSIGDVANSVIGSSEEIPFNLK